MFRAFDCPTGNIQGGVICAAFHGRSADIIAHAALWRHYEESEDWARRMLVSDLRQLVAAAAFFGVTTKNVKEEMKDFVKWFNEKEQKPCKIKK